MNKEFLNQLPSEDQTISDVLQSKARSIQVNPQFQSNLEARLKAAHAENNQPAQGSQIKIIPAIGWVILAIGAFLILNWAVRSLAPSHQPAADGTPVPDTSFETDLGTGNICAGQLAVAHGFSVFLTNQDQSGLITVDAEKTIGELRTFSWSPDGQQLAIVGITRGSGNLYLTDVAGKPLQQVVQSPEFGYLAGVSWSHGGDQLLTWEISNNTRMILVDLDGIGAAVVNLPVHSIETPQFAPDDKSILFVGGDATSYGLFRVTIDGSSQVSRISDLVENETSFAWSPDGSRLAYIEMDRELGEARLVVESEGSKNTISTLPIPKGSGSSIPSSDNLSWSPDGQSLLFEFGRNASDRIIYLATVDGSGLVPLVEAAHAAAISPDGKCLAYISADQVYLLALSKTTPAGTPKEPVLLAELPAGRGRADFQLDKLGWGAGSIPVPDTKNGNNTIPTPTPVPSGTEYDWRGVKLYLNAPLPDAPAEANLYQVNPEQPATVESARALAQRFGVEGEMYLAPGELPDTKNYLVTDGRQRLYVRSDRFFTYYADYANYSTNMFSYKEPLGDKAQGYIDEFLKSHGFDFAYQVESAPQIVNNYYVVPLSPDEFPMRFDYLLPVRLEVKLDSAGQVIFAQSSLIDYQQVGTFGLRTAEEAWQKALTDNSGAGIQEGMRGAGILEEYIWQRTYLDNQPVTIYGRLTYYPPAEAGGTPFASIGDHTVTGDLAGMEALEANTVVEANGSFSTENGIHKFKIDSWKVSEGTETSLMGTLTRNGDQALMLNYDNNQYSLADVPADAPFDTQPEQGEVNVSGVLVNGQFEWSLIQYFPAGVMGGGGGGGGGPGFYKLNLSGTPVPLPTMEEVTVKENGEYTVQEGDTLSAIAEVYGISVDDLMQLNGLTDATIFIGQKLVVPGSESVTDQQFLLGQTIDGQRGTLLITVVKLLDGGQRVEYSLQSIEEDQYLFLRLEGDNLEALQTANNRPIKVWGTINHYYEEHGINLPVLDVENYEVLYPDQKFQILKGTQQIVDIDGKSVTLFTTEEGQTYAQPDAFGGLIGNEGDQVLLEALIIPDETIAGYPVLQIVQASMAINPKSGQPAEMVITADLPNILEESVLGEQNAEPPTATIEKIELVYYTPDTRYQPSGTGTSPAYAQPVWRFYGHYSEGSEFEILVQALKDEFLLPEIEPIEPPG